MILYKNYIWTYIVNLIFHSIYIKSRLPLFNQFRKSGVYRLITVKYSSFQDWIRSKFPFLRGRETNDATSRRWLDFPGNLERLQFRFTSHLWLMKLRRTIWPFAGNCPIPVELMEPSFYAAIVRLCLLNAGITQMFCVFEISNVYTILGKTMPVHI